MIYYKAVMFLEQQWKCDFGQIKGFSWWDNEVNSLFHLAPVQQWAIGFPSVSATVEVRNNPRNNQSLNTLLHAGKKEKRKLSYISQLRDLQVVASYVCILRKEGLFPLWTASKFIYILYILPFLLF